MTKRVLRGLTLSLLGLGAVGCAREPEPQFVLSKRVEKLEAKFQGTIQGILAEQVGSPRKIKLLGAGEGASDRLVRGQVLYTKYCRQCHGVTGDGNGPAAVYMLPKPRDYRPGVFKFTSTTYGSKPLREDLVRTVRRGVMGTSMPSFDLMPQNDLDAVIDYVLALTHRGELENALADSAEFDGEVDAKAVPELVQGIIGKWKSARNQVVQPGVPMPDFTAANVQAGKAAFAVKGCVQCHGPDGRGMTKENIGVDSWGNPTKAADLTSGMLRGGTEALDIYRHIDAGINGTPMPSFHSTLSKEPETTWNLVAWVLYLSSERRRGNLPEAGFLKPLPGVKAPGESAASPAAPPATKADNDKPADTIRVGLNP